MNPALILIPIALALLQLFTKKYIFSALTTLACASIALPKAPVMAAALFVSFIGDWFMSHKGSNEMLYLCGIAGFFIAHALFIVHARSRASFSKTALICGLLLVACIGAYMVSRLPKFPSMLRIPAVLYALISIAGFSYAISTGNILYAIGIASLLFSDLMIAESDFIGNPNTHALILPTYYLSHILVALSAMI